MTTARIVLINTGSPSKWTAFDIPLSLMSDDKFEQPIFGANYMRGTVQPMYGLIPGPAKYKFWFMNGGCSKFLKAYHHIVNKLRAEMAKKTYNQTFVPQFASGNFQEQFVAFADANDPSVLYVSQPPVASQPQPMQSYLGGYTGPSYDPAAPPSYQPPYQPAAPSYQPPAPSYQPEPSYPPSVPSYQPSDPSVPFQQPIPPQQPEPPYQPGPVYNPGYPQLHQPDSIPAYNPPAAPRPNPYGSGPYQS